jgi:hypothetical protein
MEDDTTVHPSRAALGGIVLQIGHNCHFGFSF